MTSIYLDVKESYLVVIGCRRMRSRMTIVKTWRVGWSHTQESSHVKTSLHLHATDAVGQHSFGMAMHYAVYSGILLEYFAVDATFSISLRNVLKDALSSAFLSNPDT